MPDRISSPETNALSLWNSPDSPGDDAPLILVVDDERVNRDLLVEILGNEGYRTREAASGEETLRILTEEIPHLVLLDVMMPGLDGFEVCQQIKAHASTRFLPVVMVTALRQVEDRVKGIEAGADDFLSKPVDRGELLARVRSLVRMKTLHDQLAESNRALERLEEMKEQLTRLLVHDLNAPLGSLLFSVGAVLSDTPGELSERHRGLLLRAARSGDQLSGLIRDLLDISRMEEGKLTLQWENVILAEIVGEGVEELNYYADAKQITVSVDVPPGSATVCVDRKLIARVFVNLLKNALEHTPPGGRVNLRARPEGDRLRVAVEDTGVGVPSAHRERIFESFVQVEMKQSGERRGTGLGLTFCKMAVEAHGGEIGVEERSGGGSVFQFTLPLSVPAARGASAADTGAKS